MAATVSVGPCYLGQLLASILAASLAILGVPGPVAVAPVSVLMWTSPSRSPSLVSIRNTKGLNPLSCSMTSFYLSCTLKCVLPEQGMAASD